MKNDGNLAPEVPRTAQEWFVTLDERACTDTHRDSADDAALEQALAAWLARDARNGAALARCDLASALSARLANDRDLEHIYSEVAAIARGPQAAAPRPRSAFARPRFAAIAASIAAIGVAITLIVGCPRRLCEPVIDTKLMLHGALP